MVKISILDEKGHRRIELPAADAEQLIHEKGERYFVVDQKTQKIVKELKLREDQEIALIPKITGG